MWPSSTRGSDGSLPNELDGEAMAREVKAHSARLQGLAAQLRDAESTNVRKSAATSSVCGCTPGTKRARHAAHSPRHALR
jgi:hypothetical protein